MCTTVVLGPQGSQTKSGGLISCALAAHAGLHTIDRNKAGLSNCSPAAISACKWLCGACESLSVRDNDAISVSTVLIESKKINKAVFRHGQRQTFY